MMGWQNLLLRNIPRDGGGNDAGNGNGTDANAPDSNPADLGGGPGSTSLGSSPASGPNTSAPDTAGETALGGGIMGGVFGGPQTPGVVMGSEEFGPPDPNAVTNPTAPQVEAALSALNSGLLGLGSLTPGQLAANANLAGLVEAPAAVATTTSTNTSSPSTSTPSGNQSTTTDSNPADLGGDPGVSPSLGAEPSGGDTSGPGSDGGGRDDTVVPITTADVLTPVTVTPTTTTTSPVKYDVSNFLGNLGKPTYTPTPSVYSSYPISVTPQYGAPVAQQGIGQFYKPYFPLVPYQRI